MSDRAWLPAAATVWSFTVLGCHVASIGRLRLKCDGTRAETRFRLSAKRTSPFKSAGASVQSTAGSGGVRISGSNAEYTMFRGSVKSTGYPLHSPVSPFTSPPLRHRVPSYFNGLHLVTDVSGQPFGPIFEGPTPAALLAMGTVM
jgi:hypothetical protein